MAFFRLSKTKALVDQLIHIRLCNVRNHERVTLHSHLKNKGNTFSAFAYYFRDEKTKEVDLFKARSIGGSYTGIEPMGLIWAMHPDAHNRPGSSILTRDSTQTSIISLKAFGDHVPYDLLAEKEPLCEAKFERTYLSDDVERILVRHGRIRGTLFVPKGYKSCPAILDISGGGGGLQEYRAALLASKGFATLALAYFNFDDLPKDHFDLDLTYFEETVDWLLAHPKVQGHDIGLLGMCQGGDIGMLMANYFKEKIKAVIAINPWAHTFGSIVRYNDVCIMPQNFSFNGSPNHGKGLIGRQTLEKYDVEGALPMENAIASIMIIKGGDDSCIPVNTADLLAERMSRVGKTNFSIVHYPGGGHILEPPYAPHCDSAYIKAVDLVLEQGGNSKDHNIAQVDLWKRTEAFFREQLGMPVPLNKL